jgi:hypothetical protein
LPEGLKLRSLASVLTEGRSDLIALLASQDLGAQDSIVSLNAALMQDGVVIEVAPGTVIAEPVNLIHVTASPAPAAHFSRSALMIGAGASLRLAESMHVANRTQTVRAGQANACLIVSLDNGAKLAHTAMVTGTASGGVRIESVMVRIGARAREGGHDMRTTTWRCAVVMIVALPLGAPRLATALERRHKGLSLGRRKTEGTSVSATTTNGLAHGRRQEHSVQTMTLWIVGVFSNATR